MTKQRVCANTPALSRRMALAGLVVTSFAVTKANAAVEVPTATPSFIEASYRKWLDLQAQYNIPFRNLDDAESASIFDMLLETEAQILTTSPTSICDYAIKILVADDGGDLDGSDFQRGLVAEAERIVSREGTS